jgi:CRISPR system Cascade subunit CasB
MTSQTGNSYRLSAGAKGELLRWFELLQSPSVSGSLKADRAVLRRAHDLQAVVESSAYQRLYKKMAVAHEGDTWRPFQQDRIALLAALLVHVPSANEASLPKVMGQLGGGDKPIVSELRFRRILESPDMDSLFHGLRRVLPIIKAPANVHALIDDVFGWGDSVKRRWAYAYYGASL